MRTYLLYVLWALTFGSVIIWTMVLWAYMSGARAGVTRQCFNKDNTRICCWSYDNGKNWHCG